MKEDSMMENFMNESSMNTFFMTWKFHEQKISWKKIVGKKIARKHKFRERKFHEWKFQRWIFLNLKLQTFAVISEDCSLPSRLTWKTILKAFQGCHKIASVQSFKMSPHLIVLLSSANTASLSCTHFSAMATLSSHTFLASRRRCYLISLSWNFKSLLCTASV